ncbi:hypothetical protein ACLB9X_11005 [Streptomyces sp. 5K101]
MRGPLYLALAGILLALTLTSCPAGHTTTAPPAIEKGAPAWP